MPLLQSTMRSVLCTGAVLVVATGCFGPDVNDGPTDDQVRSILGADLGAQIVDSPSVYGLVNRANCTVDGQIVRGEPQDVYIESLAETNTSFPVQVASLCIGQRVTGTVEEIARNPLGAWTYWFYADQFGQWAWKAERN
jgi:hypothetical protein